VSETSYIPSTPNKQQTLVYILPTKVAPAFTLEHYADVQVQRYELFLKQPSFLGNFAI
jgi:hypothetical protein